MTPSPLFSHPDIIGLVAEQVHTCLPVNVFLLLTSILKAYHGDNIKTLLALCCASRACYHAAIPWLYRSVSLNIALPSRFQATLDAVSKNGANFVHQTVIQHGPPISEEYWLNQLKAFITTLPMLRRFK